MEVQFFEELKRELVNGYSKKGHPFRYFSLATLSDNQPVQRTVVLRKIKPDFTLVCYTDIRSEKVRQIHKNSQISALFYHPKKLMQVRIQGRAEIIKGEALQNLWRNIPENSKKDYTTSKPPGTQIKNPNAVEYESVDSNFTIIHIIPEQIEYLQLKRPNHLRVTYTLREDKWHGQFLVP